MRYLVADTHALVLQLSSRLLNHGYHFWVTAHIPEHKDAHAIDAKLLLRYDCHLSKDARGRRFRDHGRAKVSYLRCGQLVVIVATAGTSPFFQREAFKDARQTPLPVAGYSLTPGNVRIHREAMNRISRQFEFWATKRPDEWLEEKLRGVPFDTGYAGVRSQLITLIRAVNILRKRSRLEPIEWERCFRTKRLTPRKVFLPTPGDVLEAVEASRST